jgi:Pyridoxamine 5'-phosphate oxidase
MHETPEDIAALQLLLDRSYDAAGPHLRTITTPERRVGAEALVRRLAGMRLLVLATTTADGRPIAGPVDGIFFRGAFHFGSSSASVRIRHIRRRPHVSATHLPGEEFAVNVHGRATIVDLHSPDGGPLRDALLEVYVPRYGEDWEQFLEGGIDGSDPPVYARIDADKIFTFQFASEASPV